MKFGRNSTTEKSAALETVEVRIKLNRNAGANRLGLSSLGLTSLPESLGRWRRLQSLDLTNNQLTSLPPWFGQLTQLQSLRLAHNQLTSLP